MVISKLVPSHYVKLDFIFESCRSQMNFTTFVETFLPTTLILENSSFDLRMYFAVIGKEDPSLEHIAILVISKVNHV